MYQVPVQRLDRIRTSRKRVKAILTDIGLNSCQDFLKDQKSADNAEQSFEDTEWNVLTDGYQTKKRKKWCYRTQPLCCSLCWFSCRSLNTFRYHVQRCHDEEVDLASLSPCPACAYIARPALLNRHAKLFHAPPPQTAPSNTSNGNAGNKVTKTTTKTSASATQAGVRVTTVGPGGDRYSCAACTFHDSLLYVMRKHVLLNHCKSLLQKYYGCRTATAPKAQDASALNGDPGSKETGATDAQSKFYCCACSMPAETSEHLLYHLLSSAKHHELHAHIKPLLVEHCSVMTKIAPAGIKTQGSELPHLAPHALQQVVSLVSKGLANLPPVNGKAGPPKKTVLLSTHSQPTSLVCSASRGGQILLANQKAASAVPVCAVPGQAKPVSFVMASRAQGNQIPLTMAMTGSGQGQTQQVILPGGLTLNLGAKLGSVGAPGQPLVFSQRQAGKLEMQVTTAGQQMVLTQGKATTAGAGGAQTLPSDGKPAGGCQPVVLTQGKALGPSMILAARNANAFAAVAPSQSLVIGGQVGAVRPMMLNQALSLQSQQHGGSLLSSHSAVSFVATGNKMGPAQPLMLNQGLSLQSSQSTVRLIPTGNKVNGMPTYTLAAVQMTVPCQAGVAKPPMLVNVPPQTPPVASPVPQATPGPVPGPVPTKLAEVSSVTVKAPVVQQATPGPVPTTQAGVPPAAGKEAAAAPPVPQAEPGTVPTKRVDLSSVAGKTPAPPVSPATPSLARPKRAAAVAATAAVSSPTGVSLGASSQYVKRSPSGELECLRCKSAFSEQGLYQHLLHGMHCLLCPMVFYSFRELGSHCYQAHSLVHQANRDRLWKAHRLLATKEGRFFCQTPALGVKVPKDMLGCKELHLALVHKDKDLEVTHLHLTERLNKHHAPCPFCPDLRPLVTASAAVLHLRRRHHVMHAIHAILKTPAFKCVYCLGVYAEQASPRTISIHVQRCREAPQHVKEAEKRLNNRDGTGATTTATRAAAKVAAAKVAATAGVVRTATKVAAVATKARLKPEATPPSVPYDDTPLEVPAGLGQTPPSERKRFLHKYFQKTPNPTRKQIEVLVSRLNLSAPEVTSIFSAKRRLCHQDCLRRGLRVLLGFDSCSLKSVKHSLIIPQGPTRRGRTANNDTQTMLVECKQEPPDPMEVIGPLGDHAYAEPLNPSGPLRLKTEKPDRTGDSGNLP